jgi:uncharacterized protein Veg
MKKKLRKFSQGGFETKMGRNEGASIDDDIRTRAMKSVEGLEGIKGSDIADETGTVQGSIKRNEYGDLYDSAMKVAKPKPVVSTPVTSKVDMDAERARIKSINEKQGLKGVYPEEFIVGGAGKALQVAGTKLASKIATDRAAKQASEAAAKNVTRRSEEGFNPSEAMEALKPTRTRTIKGKDIPVRQGKPNFSGTADNVGVKTVTNKSGKKIPVNKQKEDAGDGGSGAFKRGGTVSKADMKKAGFYDKDKTKSERQKIVNKVTTKPQRVAIVEKAFSSKNMKSGGMASRRADGCAIRGKTRA